MSDDRTNWLRHPIVNIVLGFVLTGVLGTAITQNFMDQREQEKLRAQVAIDRKLAIQQFTRLNEERRVRAEMMVNALRNGSNDDEVKVARQEYEKAFVAWSVERPGTLLLFRDLLSSENYQIVETGVEESLVEKIFSPIRHCLTAALSQSDDRDSVSKTLDACQIDELLAISSSCSLALAVAVSDLVETNSKWVSKESMAELQQQAKGLIAKQCP